MSASHKLFASKYNVANERPQKTDIGLIGSGLLLPKLCFDPQLAKSRQKPLAQKMVSGGKRYRNPFSGPRDDAISQVVLVQHRPAAGRPPHHVKSQSLASIGIEARSPLQTTQGYPRWIPLVET